MTNSIFTRIHWWLGPAVLSLLTIWPGPQAAAADDFELAMVIKETTNPYYNATLAGARIAAEEIGGKANQTSLKFSV